MNTQRIINWCDSFNDELESITGMDSNSTSASDIWFIKLKKGLLQEQLGTDELVMKLYASRVIFPQQSTIDQYKQSSDIYQYFDDTNNTTAHKREKKEIIRNRISSMKYEGLIYQYLCGFMNYGGKRCNPLNPNFSTFYGIQNGVSFNKLHTILNQGQKSDAYRFFDQQGLEGKVGEAVKAADKQITSRLYRNLKFTIIEKRNRPAIHNVATSDDTENDKQFIREKTKYGFIITKPFSKVNNQFSTLYDFIATKRHNEVMIPLIVQIISGLNTMSMMEVVHNDFHANNVYVRKLDNDETFKLDHTLSNGNKTQFKYTLPKNSYGVQIFDFDRSYAPDIGSNDLLAKYDKKWCSQILQCNEYGKGRDLLRLIAHLHVAGYKSISKKLIECISKNDTSKTDINNRISDINPCNTKHNRMFNTLVLKENTQGVCEAYTADWLNDNINDMGDVIHAFIESYPNIVKIETGHMSVHYDNTTSNILKKLDEYNATKDVDDCIRAIGTARQYHLYEQ
jgi:hypothetical protein